MSARAAISPNSRVLIVAIVLFALITTAQFAAALAANSNALLVDCASMLVDTMSYIFNLITECSASENEKRTMRRGLISSFLSIVVLCGITAWGLAGSLEILLQKGSVPDTLEPVLVVIFGVLGLAVDVVAMAAFKVWGFQLEESHTSETESSSFVNMCSAFAHVLADSIRSITSVILGLVVIYDDSVNGSVCDAIATLVVASTIIVGTVPLVAKWFRTASDYFSFERRHSQATKENAVPPPMPLPKDHLSSSSSSTTTTAEAKEAPAASEVATTSGGSTDRELELV